MSTTDGGRGGDSDFFGPLERSGAVRGWILVVVAIVLGALLMPSAARAPLATAGAESAAGGTNQPTTTLPPATTTTAAPTTTTTAPRLSPGSVSVLVANGTNTNGAAAAVTSFLAGKGFSTLHAVDALTTVHASQIYAVNGANSAAAAVAAALGLTSTSIEANSMPVPVSSTGGANVVVIVGPDLVSRTSTTGA
ncbi:MAG: LytR C-terminal domain-containing protein [Acidimicrobiales bacterium]